ncbi:MAG: hypothetical protein KAS48_03415 [Gammaproteobacteria bacterium]|nr:hypothetical protein [Gammaproteobacteria bacterium]
MDARMSQQAMEGLFGKPEYGEKHRKPEGQVVGCLFLWFLSFGQAKERN